MGLCSDVLYSNLVTDLTPYLCFSESSPLVDPLTKVDLTQSIIDGVAASTLLTNINKKNTDSKSVDADSLALEKFLASNQRCADFSLDIMNLSDHARTLLGEFESIIHDSLNPTSDQRAWFNMDFIQNSTDVGPGSSVGATGTSFYNKIACSLLTTTSTRLYDLYKSYVKHFTLEAETEKNRQAIWGECKIVQGSNLAFAPKNSLISRVICTEPLLNMYYQKGLAAGFERVLRSSFGIELATQPTKNQELARLGSIDGSFGTIDLSSASDTISMKMIEMFFPKKFIQWMELFRSDYTKLPSGSFVELQMISSMGNAFTFPLETLIFSCAVKAVYNVNKIPFLRPRGKQLGNFAVFGDDIIVVSNAYDDVISLLNLLGFSANPEKSFNKGFFRESCGADWYLGSNVRAVYAKTLKTPQSVYSLINNLQIWACNHSIPLCRTLNYLRAENWLIPIPPWENVDAGIMVPERVALNIVFEAGHKLVKEQKPVKLDQNGSYLYMRYLPLPDFVSLLNVGQRPFILSKKGNKKVVTQHNNAGILLAAVKGCLRNGNLGQRILTPRYIRSLGVAPCWDYRERLSSKFTMAGWHNWVTDYEAYCI